MDDQTKMEHIAQSMGIALYQRFTLQEASLFLRCSQDSIKKLIQTHQIEYIQVTSTDIQFFGYQLLQHLLSNVSEPIQQTTAPKHESASQDRIVRTSELQQIVGLSRSTIWRLEQKGDFPKRVPLGSSSVGWLKSDVEAWLQQRK